MDNRVELPKKFPPKDRNFCKAQPVWEVCPGSEDIENGVWTFWSRQTGILPVASWVSRRDYSSHLMYRYAVEYFLEQNDIEAIKDWTRWIKEVNG